MDKMQPKDMVASQGILCNSAMIWKGIIRSVIVAALCHGEPMVIAYSQQGEKGAKKSK